MPTKTSGGPAGQQIQTLCLSAAEMRLDAKDADIAQMMQAASDVALAQATAYRAVECQVMGLQDCLTGVVGAH